MGFKVLGVYSLVGVLLHELVLELVLAQSVVELLQIIALYGAALHPKYVENVLGVLNVRHSALLFIDFSR